MRTSLIATTVACLAFGQADGWQTHHDAVKRALARKQYDVAVREAQAGFDSVQRYGPSDPRYIRSLMDRADTQRSDVAIDTLRRALESAQSAGTLAKDPALNDELRTKLAQSLIWLIRDSNPRPSFKDQENLSRQALAVIAGLDKDSTNLLVQAVSSLAFALSRQGYYAAAESALRRGLAVREDVVLLSDLAEVVYREGYMADAEALLNRAISLDAASTSADRFQFPLFERLYSLAVVNIDRGQHSVAEALLEQSRQAANGIYSEILLNHALGNLACARRQFDSAKDRFRQGLAASEDSRWRYPRGEMLIDMGRCAIKEKDFNAAGSFLDAAKAIFDAGFRRDHPVAAQILWQQALLLEAQKKPADADPLLTRAISMLENAAGPKAPIVGAALQDLGRIRKAAGDAAGAAQLMARTRGIQKPTDTRPLPAVDKDLTPAKAAEMAYWDTIQDRDDAVLFRQYVADFPKGQFVALAREHVGQPLPDGAPCAQDFDAVPEPALPACITFWRKTGYAPVALAAYQEAGRILFVGAFDKGADRLVTYLLALEEFKQRININRERGYRPATITVLAGPPGPRFTSTWVKLEPGVSVTTGAFGDDLRREFEDQTARKNRNTALVIYFNQGLKYMGVWEPSHGVDSKLFPDVIRENPGASLTNQGYRPTNIVGYQIGGEVRYAAVWTKNAEPWQASRGVSKSDYLKWRDQYKRQGYSLDYVQVFGDNFCTIWHKAGR